VINFLKKISNHLLEMPRFSKRLIAVLVDCSLCTLAVWLAFYLRLGEFVTLSNDTLWAVYLSVAIAIPIFVMSGLYRAIFRYTGWPALLAIAKATSIYSILYAAVFTVIGMDDVPRTVGLIQPILLLIFVGVSRVLARFWLGDQYLKILKRVSKPKVLIYGAGQAGRQLAGALRNSYDMQVVGFLDDDDRLYGQVLSGYRIYNPAELGLLVKDLSVSTVLLAMPSVNRKRRSEIINQIVKLHVSVRTLPSVNDLVHGRVKVSDIKELDIDDLLRRQQVIPNHILLAKNCTDKVVLVTGSGGSIGSELCRQILTLNPKKLLLIEQSEFALYAVFHELEKKLNNLNVVLVPLLASVQDEDRMREIMTTWRPDTVYHAAAYKHVPLVEHNPAEGIKNNVFGTLKTARLAIESGVSDFVLISTDKAVRPTNIMGASKRLAEMTLQALAEVYLDTNLTMVRFGNVLGSSGSVVPKFRQQIRDGGPITLTHPDVTRFFMTIPEAAQLVIQAGAMSNSGDVFVLDMGESVKIIDLAKSMIELSGLTLKDQENPDGDIEIEISGLRPGEKLFEELLIGNNPEKTLHSSIVKAHEVFIPWYELEIKLHTLEAALNISDINIIRAMMQELVMDYAPSDEVVDWVYLEQESEIQINHENELL
jgi:FlaA1/EpsC-like NDP-sugar epimerase